MAMGREALFTAGYLGLVPSMSRYARESHGLGDEASRVVGAIGGGVIVGTLSHPFDTVKTCQQVCIHIRCLSCLFWCRNTPFSIEVIAEMGRSSYFSHLLSKIQ